MSVAVYAYIGVCVYVSMCLCMDRRAVTLPVPTYHCISTILDSGLVLDCQGYGLGYDFSFICAPAYTQPKRIDWATLRWIWTLDIITQVGQLAGLRSPKLYTCALPPSGRAPLTSYLLHSTPRIRPIPHTMQNALSPSSYPRPKGQPITSSLLAIPTHSIPSHNEISANTEPRRPTPSCPMRHTPPDSMPDADVVRPRPTPAAS
ncbi:hypothetical protein CVT25_001457 [Psilocybe cyanescens]|uniref:Uncharacterized protein n=1 Tax=Psilocybe cyanescens TaxID=93625 RepID=A0A409WNT8_PSICY|nr:hypothetical protein CVT25_001457 [Psilocybe cyanescens]